LKWLGHSTFTLTLGTCGDYMPVQNGGAMNVLPEPPGREPCSGGR